jgi:S-DNA-T family DNA segregation ATPase FtsK/SpoIIIE
MPSATFTLTPAARPARPAGSVSSGAVDAPAPTGTTPIEAAVEAETALPAHEWLLPEMAEILEPGVEGKADEEFSRERARLIEETLAAFGAPSPVVEINRGPTITQFGVEPDFVEVRGGKRVKVKVGKIAALADDLALALAAQSIRVEAPVPGKGFVGIEVPNLRSRWWRCAMCSRRSPSASFARRCGSGWVATSPAGRSRPTW